MTIRGGREQQWWSLSLFIVGFAFYAAELVLGNSMSPRTYGYAAYDIAAATWAQGFMSASALVLYGLYINGRWPAWSPILRAVGWSMLTAMFAFMAVSAWFAEDGIHIVIFAVMFFGRRSITFAIISVAEARARRNQSGAG